MTIQWSDTVDEIYDVLGADAFRPGGKWSNRVLKWGNRVIRDICMEIDIRNHLVLSASRTFTTSDYSVSLPSNFFKISDRFTTVRVGEDYVDIIPLETLNENDPDHDSTTSNDAPDYCALEGRRVYVYPMFSGTLVIENYFREPTDMGGGNSFPDLPDDTVMQDLLIAGVCRKGFRLLDDPEKKMENDNEYGYYLDLYRFHIDKSNSRKAVEAKYY